MIAEAVAVALLAAGQTADAGCDDSARRTLDSARARILRGDPRAAEALAPEASTVERCALVEIARLSLRGWREARALAPRGGALELLAPVRGVLAELARVESSTLALETEYAVTALRAAVAAAQDERPEMELLLTHARDLSERLVARGRRAEWPRPFNLLAGELWLEVDRYDAARRAFERAVSAEAAPIALAGLARSLARLGRASEACEAYRRVRDAEGALAEEVGAFLAACP